MKLHQPEDEFIDGGEPNQPRLPARRADLWFAAAPCVLFGLLVALCVAAGADLPTSSCFYCPEQQAWPLAEAEPWGTLYRYGCVPAIVVGSFGLLFGLIGIASPSRREWRRPGLFLAATLLLGPGLMINLVLKPGVGRPRPKETTHFGGAMQFGYVGGATAAEQSRSFPSGHASMGFFFMTPALLLYRRRPGVAAAVLGGGIAYGALMSLARIAQGAHFVTDVLSSALLVYLSALIVLAVGEAVSLAKARWLRRLTVARATSVEPPRDSLTAPARKAA
ncbi:MAG: phosphatase PAP2 family protein [Planctomycetota bacterium]